MCDNKTENKDFENEYYSKHFELLQNAITRLSSQSFSMKQWCLTIVTIIISVLTLTKESSIEIELKLVFLRGLVVLTICFWFLDSFYLWSERKLRKLYEDSVTKFNEKNNTNLFSMKTSEEKKCYYTYLGTFLSKTEWPIYSILIGLEIALLILINKQ